MRGFFAGLVLLAVLPLTVWGQIPAGIEFQVNSYTTSSQTAPAVASDANGNFVVVWFSDGQDGSGYGVFGRRFNSAGALQGSEFRVNSYTTGFQRDAAVASSPDGGARRDRLGRLRLREAHRMTRSMPD